jgi:hypothetical protein
MAMIKSNTEGLKILERAFEINLATLLKKSRDLSSNILTIGDSFSMLIAVISQHQINIVSGDAIATLDVVAIPCLKGRFRPLFRCPRAHEGNFQSIYLCDGVLACRKCHNLRYQSNLAGCAKDRARIQRYKMMKRLGRKTDGKLPNQRKFEWQKKYFAKISKIQELENNHYLELRQMLNGMRKRSSN